MDNKLNPEEIRSITNDDNTFLIGYISSIEKNKFYAIFDRKNATSLQLEQKKKRLNLKQKELLDLGHILKLDFQNGKLYFMNSSKEWI